ncbi:hypothetical protein [Mesorhizobium sp. M0767]|uniref:phage tail tape measure protein n=1 Tax=Mesorhizobium sp. M0767 TaxID=2956995 RepID=UPI003336CD0F
MVTGTPRYLAFRVFGDFHWPFSVKKIDSAIEDLPPEKRRKGVVEFYFGGSDPKALSGFLRWVPYDGSRAIPERFVDPIGDEDVTDIRAVNDTDLLKKFDNLGDGESLVLRLGGPGKSLTYFGPRLLLRGSFLFDQFALHAEADVLEAIDIPADLRWVLARTFRQQGKSYFSEVVVGQNGDDAASGCRIRFNLALPTPAPQSGSDVNRCYALPFAVIFSPVQPLPELPAPLTIKSFIAGPGPATAVHDSVVTVSGKVTEPWLGHFGFCGGQKAGGKEFLYFPRDEKEGSLRFDQYWPTNRTAFIEDVLGKFSTVRNGDTERISLGSSYKDSTGEIWHSVDFSKEDGEQSSTTMTFRTKLLAKGYLLAPGAVTDDLHVTTDPHFLLRLPGFPNSFVSTSSPDLIVELKVAFRISDDSIWSLPSGPMPGGGQITVRLGFDASLDVNAGSVPGTSLDPLTTVFDNAIKGLRLVRLDLRNVANQEPQTILPEIEIESKEARFLLCGVVSFAFQPSSFQGGTIHWESPFPARDVWPGIDLNLSLWPDRRLLSTERNSIARVPVTLRPFSFGYVPAELKLNLLFDPSVPSADFSRFCRFRIAGRDHMENLPFGARLGGLEFVTSKVGINDDTADMNDYSYWRFGERDPSTFKLPSSNNAFQLANVDFRLRLEISSVRPISPDIPWGDRTDRPAPLLIPAGGVTGKGKFILDLRETVAEFHDRQLTASIYDIGTGDPDADIYVVLSEEPFTITRIRSQPLQDRGAQDNALVATFDSDTRQWQVKLTSPTYHYEFPPQVAGESMDKPRRLEIMDYPEVEVANGPLPPEPNNVARPIDRNGNPRAIEFRLTPSAELWIRPSDVERGYFLPEWASHEIFRQRGDFGIGAAMAGMRAEFLYGLSVGVDPTRERGAARSARIAEIEALTGSPPRMLGVSNVSTDLAARWRSLDRVLAHRPERIEIWAREPDSSVPFAPAKFSGGVAFALRQTALHAPPVPFAKDELKDLDKPGTGRPRVSDKGLSGGALWPLESKNFFNALLERPTSQGGTIEQIALSPAGGDANQMAEFLNRKVRIISETRNGFVQRHQVEIIGRISVFWHWAKHVVVYERTVNPSAQFTPDLGIGNRTRRPVLRKVSEYVYIRQPQGTRRYPDFPTANPSSSGLLKAAKFNSITINVDSAWSEDVGKYGWKIPLWNRDAARRRPQVYPRPDIGFSTFAEGLGMEAEATQECLEPDNIYFYADASPDTGPDTDSWPSLIGIDCSQLPPPSHAFQAKLSPDEASERDDSASAPRIPRGHRRFTWRLAPPSKKTALNAGRSAQPLFAGLESITFMRSNAPEPTDANKKAIDAMATAVASADALVHLPPGETTEYWLKGKASPIAAFKPVDAFLAAVAMETPVKDEVLQKARDLADTLTTNLASADGVKKPIEAASKYALQLKALDPYLTDGPSRCEQMAADLIGSIRRKELLILDALRTWEANAEGAIPKDPVNLKKLKDTLASEAAEVVARALSGVAADLGRLDVGIEKARSILHDFENDIHQAEDAADQQLRALRAAYNDTKPWSKTRLDDLEEKLRAAGARAFQMVKTAVEEAAGRLATELDDAAQKIGYALQDAILAVDEEDSALKKAIDDSWQLAKTYLDTAIVKLDQLLERTDGKDLFDRLDETLAHFQKKVVAKYPDKAAVIDKARQGLTLVRTEAQTARTKLQSIKDTNPNVALIELVDIAAREGEAVLNALAETVQQAASAATGYEEEALRIAAADVGSALTKFERLANDAIGLMRYFGAGIDSIVDAGIANIHDALEKNLFDQIEGWWLRADETAAGIRDRLAKVKQDLGADYIATLIKSHVLEPAIDATFAEITEAFLADYTNARKRLVVLIEETSTNVEAKLKNLTDAALGDTKKAIVDACKSVAGGINDTFNYLDQMKSEVEKEAASIADPLVQSVKDVIDDVDKLRRVAEGIAGNIRQLNNNIATSYASAKAYTNRVLESAGNLGTGGVGAAPGNILRLYAAAASAPTVPNLDFARERLGYYFNQLNDVIDTTPVEARFGRLGDDLKALGLSIPFSKIGDRILPDDMSGFDVSRIFKNFSGMKLDKLFRGYKLPAGAKDAIKVTHSFDKAQVRAWVQIDVDLPMRERKALFAVGPFEVDFVDSRFLAIVRLEASKDSDKVDQIGRAILTTNIDFVVGGQSMITLQKVALHYEKSSGLTVEFDPKNIKLNAVFRFIQDTLGSLFPDEIGGMKIIKDRGIPVGIEHEFAMPPVSLNFATSGVTNILINNRFGLIAFPEFVISDRFSLSKPEMPFIFSIFIIGGTGYITVDTEYRPFTNKGLMVVVEAAAGGSAQLAFAFGPVSGTVFITLSIALAYRKIFGQDGGGLTVSLVLVIAGNVDVAGLVNIYIGLLLRMSYRDNGAIDATGTLTVTIRISRFFKISVRANVNYQLRGGQSKTTTSISANGEIIDPRFAEAKDKAEKLLKARG